MQKGRAFTEKAEMPTEDKLKEILSSNHENYLDLLSLVENYSTKWTFYKGWSQKFFDKKKALFYMIPCYNCFRINMTIRELEKDKILLNKNVSYTHDKLRNAEKYSEGYFLQFEVKEKVSSIECCSFIKELLILRSNKK